MSEMKDMWRCPTPNCGYIYDPDRGDRRHHIPKGTKFGDLPDDWVCPVCGASKKNFHRLSDEKYGGFVSEQKRQPSGCLFCPPAWACPDGEKPENGKKYLRAGFACQAGVYAIG